MMYLLLSSVAVLMTVSNGQLIPDCQSFRVGVPGDYSIYPIGGYCVSLDGNSVKAYCINGEVKASAWENNLYCSGTAVATNVDPCDLSDDSSCAVTNYDCSSSECSLAEYEVYDERPSCSGSPSDVGSGILDWCYDGVAFSCISGGLIQVTYAPNGNCDATTNVFTYTAANSECIDVEGTGFKITCPTTTSSSTSSTTSTTASGGSSSSGNVSENGVSNNKSVFVPAVFILIIGALLK
mmetsp:Transcript_68514/g.61558  ORF Transcript_68514/g.61558 Transcript_68514/m.61558 type:complete len:238 (-) Transcript_68514:61-774(-)